MTVQTDVKPAETVNTAPQQNTNQDQNKGQQQVVEQVEETPQERNWKAFKEAREAERKQAEEIARQAKKSQEEATALKAALDAVLNKPQSMQHEEQHEESDDQRIAKLVSIEIAKREKEYEEKHAAQEKMETPKRLKSTYKDFEMVCSKENLDYLDFHYPHITKPFAYMPEGYEKWEAVYHSVKQFVPNPDSKKDSAKADKNFAKPQSMSSPTLTSSGENRPAFKLDESRKAENWARMQKIMNKLE